MPLRQIACMVDSLTQGTGGGYSIAQGGLGGWAELVAERLANISGIGPLISSGIRGVWMVNQTNYEWVDTGSWTAVTGSNAWDKAPSLRSANGGTGFVMNYRVPPQYRKIVGVAVYYVDTGGNWQYRKDGGPWTNHGQTIQNNNALKKFYLSGAVASTFEVRAYDGSSNTACLPVGIELFYADPVSATQGLIMHNLGVGGQSLNTRMNSASGDKNAFFDAVTLGTGSPISNAPSSGVFQLGINDVDQVNNTTTWNTDLVALKTRVVTTNGWPLGFINPYETDTSFRPAVDQAAYRAQTKTTGTAQSVPVFDLYDSLAAKGITGYAQTLAAGLLISAADAHPNQAGNLYLADRIYWWLRTQFFAIGNVPSSYTASAKQAAVQYSGKLPAVQYSAGAPISV